MYKILFYSSHLFLVLYILYLYLLRMMHLFENGLVQRWIEETFPQFQCDNKETEVASKRVTLYNITGTILLLAMGIITASCVLFIEIQINSYCYKRKNKARRKQDKQQKFKTPWEYFHEVFLASRIDFYKVIYSTY